MYVGVYVYFGSYHNVQQNTYYETKENWQTI